MDLGSHMAFYYVPILLTTTVNFMRASITSGK